MKKKEMKIKDIKEYENNPRDNAMAVDAVAKSIRKYGYNQPIVVDSAGMVIVGHTRLAALRQLNEQGHKEFSAVEVLQSDMDPETARRHRIADNKTGEKADWYVPYLRAELREMDEGAVREMFTDSELKSLQDSVSTEHQWEVTDEQIEQQRQRMLEHQRKMNSPKEDDMVEVTCGECENVFYVRESNLRANADIDG